ncbi:MAG: hypothetical protein VKL42_13915 [Snowella sp.]|nr:hypothetical protein [Snowella sp.]
MEISLAAPTPFISNHWPQLLPDWTEAPQTLILVCLPAQYSLAAEGLLIATEKDRLLQEFQTLADHLQQQAAQQGIRLESICPKNGTPRYSRAGNLHFDIVAAFHTCLGFDFVRTEKGCKLLCHPQWNQACYPGLLVSASPLLKNFFWVTHDV